MEHHILYLKYFFALLLGRVFFVVIFFPKNIFLYLVLALSPHSTGYLHLFLFPKRTPSIFLQKKRNGNSKYKYRSIFVQIHTDNCIFSTVLKGQHNIERTGWMEDKWTTVIRTSLTTLYFLRDFHLRKISLFSIKNNNPFKKSSCLGTIKLVRIGCDRI